MEGGFKILPLRNVDRESNIFLSASINFLVPFWRFFVMDFLSWKYLLDFKHFNKIIGCMSGYINGYLRVLAQVVGVSTLVGLSLDSLSLF